MKIQKNIFQVNGPQKQAGLVILISDKNRLQIKMSLHINKGNNPVGRDNNCAPNIDTPNWHTLLDLQAQIDPNTIVVGDFNTSLTNK
jgi:hypothetical protein